MMTYDRKCPTCGKMNRKMYLEETDGFMECERCGEVSFVQWLPSGDLSRREHKYDTFKALLDEVVAFVGSGEVT